MISEVKRVQQYYDGDDEENRFSDPRKKIEFINTCRIIEPFINEGCILLDCAAGTGAYEDFLLNQKCKRVVASDLSPRNVEILTTNFPDIETFVDDACDLSRHKSNTFDVVLCLGPMYHLRPELHEKCVEECLRVLKEKGMLILAYMPRHFVLWNLMNNPVYKIPFDEVLYLAKNGFLPNQHDGFWGCAYFSTPEEMERLVNKMHCEIIEHRAVDLELGNFYDKVANCTQKQLDEICDYLYDKSNDRFILGSSKHNILVVQK